MTDKSITLCNVHRYVWAVLTFLYGQINHRPGRFPHV